MAVICVKQEHIDKGIPQDAEQCPIACALKDHGYAVAEVDIWNIYVDGKIYFVEDRIADFIETFDIEDFMVPFNFAFINGEARIVE